MKEPFQIAASQARAIGNFDDMVRAFALEMTTWQQHSAKVGREDGYEAYPPPQTHRMIQMAIALADDGASWVPNFVILDDAPDAEVILRQRKNALLSQVIAIETNASVAIFPPGKRRLFEMKEAAVMARDAERRKQVEDKKNADVTSAISSLSSADAKDARKLQAAYTSGMTDDQMKAAVIDGRPKEDVVFVAEYASIRQRLEAALLHSAQVCFDIEDLTAETIEGWSIPPFPGS